MREMKHNKFYFIFLTLFLSCLLIGCNDSDSDSDKSKSVDVEKTWYRDADGDGYGDQSVSLYQAIQPAGYVDNSGDCADYDADIFPGATELCDGEDNNCDGMVDENACDLELQKISGRISNLSEAQSYISDDSYLQLVFYPADGLPVFSNDTQGRRIYTSDLASVDFPDDGAFLIETSGLISGDYVVAAQVLDPYEQNSGVVPILSYENDQPVVFSVAADDDTVLNVDLGDVRLPVPAIVINQLQVGLESPNGVSATDGEFEDKIRVTWNASTGATSYEVYRAGSFAGQKIKIATTSATSHDDTSVPCDVDFYYWIKAVNSSGSSNLFYSDLGFIRCPIPVEEPQSVVVEEKEEEIVTEMEAPVEESVDKPISLTAPTGVIASDGTYQDKVCITWNPVTNATSYDVYRCSTCCGLKIKIGSSNSRTYDDFDVNLLNIYYYWIKANNDSGTSEFSIFDTGHIYKLVRPFEPSWVKASDGTLLNQVLVKWGKSPENSNKFYKSTASYYEIYRAKSAVSPKTMIGKTSANQSLDHFDKDLNCSTCCPDSFVYWVKAVNAAGISNFSEHDLGYTYRTLRDPDVSATDGKRNCVWVSWISVSGATHYDIYRSDSATGEKIKIKSIKSPTNTYSDTTTTCPTVYYYWVKVIDAKGYTSCTFGDYDTGYCVAE